MTRRTEDEMRAYWDERARMNAPWYVDTTLDYEHPDMQRFFESGVETLAYALDHAPRAPARTEAALEIGAGLGRICRALAHRFDRVVGIDISEEMLRRARELVGEDRICFVVGDGSTLGGIADASVDMVLTFTVFQHIPQATVVERYLEDVGRVLRPGGLFVFQWNNTKGAIRWRLRRVIMTALRRLGYSADRYGRDAPAFMGSRIQLRRIQAALERGGLELLKTEGTGTLFAFAWAGRSDRG